MKSSLLNDTLLSTLANAGKDVKNKTYAMLMNLTDWTAFSNHTPQPNTTEVATSIEGIHDFIHGTAGGEGQMGDAAIACKPLLLHGYSTD
jgi:hypothetical protein